MSDQIMDRVGPNQPAPIDEHWLEKKRPSWIGMPFDHGATVAEINSRYPFLDKGQLERGRAMFSGFKQWDPADHERRHSSGRPTLTMNRIPELLGRAVINSTEAGHVVTKEQLDRCAAILGLENTFAQRQYNFMLSTIAEFEMRRPPRIVMTADQLDHVDEDGTIFVKPPWDGNPASLSDEQLDKMRLALERIAYGDVKPPDLGHRNWLVRLLARVIAWFDKRTTNLQ